MVNSIPSLVHNVFSAPFAIFSLHNQSFQLKFIRHHRQLPPKWKVSQRHVVLYSRWRLRHSRSHPPVLEVPLRERINFGELFSTSLAFFTLFFFLTRIHLCISVSPSLSTTNYLLAGSSVQVAQAPSYIALYITRLLSTSKRSILCHPQCGSRCGM